MVSITKGIATIKTHLAILPDAPGVYRMLGDKGAVLYVGKAKSLKKRVASYTRLQGLPNRLKRMVANTETMEFVTTRSEAEALLVEASLIKSLKPHYNILLRDDKSFPYLTFDTTHKYPRISSYRGSKKQGITYFGPYPSALSVREAITALQKTFLLRPCSDNVFNNRTRPCLQYHIKRCSAPCVGHISAEDYGLLLHQAIDCLNGKSDAVHQALAQAMQHASDITDFETAARYRDRLKALSTMRATQKILFPSLDDADAIGLAMRAGTACVQWMRFRNGQNIGTGAHFIAIEKDDSPAQILRDFMAQYYSSNPPPALILTATLPDETPLLSEALSHHHAKTIHIHKPLRGEKAQALALAAKNALDALERKLTHQAGHQTLLLALAERLKLPHSPKRIEIYDNSHIQGAHAIGAMVVAGEEGFIKPAYRTFTIKQAQTNDDFAMMREVITRRFRHLSQTTNSDKADPLPDLMIIDGGKGQVNAVQDMLNAMGIGHIQIIGMAKGIDRNAGREELIMPNQTPFRLAENDPALYLMQRLRDEAHRFAIGTHRKKRGKAMVESSLDNIPNIGAKRKKALLQHFGSAKAVSEASLDDLLQVNGISRHAALAIVEFYGQN